MPKPGRGRKAAAKVVEEMKVIEAEVPASPAKKGRRGAKLIEEVQKPETPAKRGRRLVGYKARKLLNFFVDFFQFCLFLTF